MHACSLLDRTPHPLTTGPWPHCRPQFSAAPVNLLSAGAAAAPWQLCFEAPPDAHSLMLLFNLLDLPEGASLRVCPAPPLTTARCVDLGAGRLLAAVPGSTATLSFTPGSANSSAAVAELGAVLQGVQPLPGQPATSAAEAAQRKAVSAEAAAALEQALSNVLGTSNIGCPYLDVACAGSEWQQPAGAVMLLLLASPKGGLSQAALPGLWVLGLSCTPVAPERLMCGTHKACVPALSAGARFCTGKCGLAQWGRGAEYQGAHVLVGAVRLPTPPPLPQPAPGAVLNTAHLGGSAAYILSASHCRGFDSDGDAQFYQVQRCELGCSNSSTADAEGNQPARTGVPAL